MKPGLYHHTAEATTFTASTSADAEVQPLPPIPLEISTLTTRSICAEFNRNIALATLLLMLSKLSTIERAAVLAKNPP
jgi:hypothetical protein